MGYLFVTESSAKVSFEDNTFCVRKKDQSVTHVPAETLESISFFGNPQMTTQCMQQCMRRGIPSRSIQREDSILAGCNQRDM